MYFHGTFIQSIHCIDITQGQTVQYEPIISRKQTAPHIDQSIADVNNSSHWYITMYRFCIWRENKYSMNSYTYQHNISLSQGIDKITNIGKSKHIFAINTVLIAHKKPQVLKSAYHRCDLRQAMFCIIGGNACRKYNTKTKQNWQSCNKIVIQPNEPEKATKTDFQRTSRA